MKHTPENAQMPRIKQQNWPMINSTVLVLMKNRHPTGTDGNRSHPAAWRLGSAAGVFGDAMGRAHDHVHPSARTHNSKPQGMPERKLVEVRRIEPCGLFVETERGHYGRFVGIVSEPED